MRGEELQGLNIEDLQQLEKSLEAGLSRVIQKKVHVYFLSMNFALSLGSAQIVTLDVFHMLLRVKES